VIYNTLTVEVTNECVDSDRWETEGPAVVQCYGLRQP